MAPKTKYFPKFEAALPEQTGKIVAITGTTTGTGLVAAKTSLKKGATTFLLNRNEDKARKALADLFAAEPETEKNALFIQCDLQSFDSVKAAAAEVISICEEKEFQALDVFCANAGVVGLIDQRTADGYEVQMQTNHLSHFLLTRLLFPLLVKSKEARVVTHTSTSRLLPGYLKRSHYQKGDKKLGGNGTSVLFGGRWARYHQTKLACTLFTIQFKKRLLAAGIKNVLSVSAHPGLAATDFQNSDAEGGGIGKVTLMPLSQTSEDGAMGILRAMFGKVKNGGIYGPANLTGKPNPRGPGIFATSTGGKRMWEETEKAVGKFDFSEGV